MTKGVIEKISPVCSIVKFVIGGMVTLLSQGELGGDSSPSD